MAKGDQFWLPKSVRPAGPILAAKMVRGTSFSAKIGLAGPILGGTDFGVTVHTGNTEVFMGPFVIACHHGNNSDLTCFCISVEITP